MLHSDGAVGTDRSTVVELATAAFGLLFAWIALFERGLEPLARQIAGRVFGCAIVWWPVGPFRIWGPRESADRRQEAAIAVCCIAVVLAAAAVPVAALHLVSVALEERGQDVSAATYLVSLPMMAIFVLRVGRLGPSR